jgi:hypothetical protein
MKIVTNRQDTSDPQKLKNLLIKGNHDPQGVQFIQVRIKIGKENKRYNLIT